MGHFAHPLRRTRRRGLARAVRRWLLGQSARRSQTGRRPGYSTGRKKRAVQERVGPNPTDRGKAGVQKSGLVEGNGGPLSAAISGANTPDGKLLGSAGNDNTIRLWNPRAGNLERMLETHGVLVVNALAFSPDGKTIACGGNDGNARLWDLKSETITRTLTGQGATVQAVAFSPNGKLLACGCQNGVINVWRLH